jgi:Ribbon-helix-helix protein, copG family
MSKTNPQSGEQEKMVGETILNTGQQEENSQKETKTRTKERVQLDFAPEALERLDKLREQTGASTRAETIRQALRLFEWFVNDTDPNDTITITDSSGEMVAMFKARLLHNETKHS